MAPSPIPQKTQATIPIPQVPNAPYAITQIPKPSFPVQGPSEKPAFNISMPHTPKIPTMPKMPSQKNTDHATTFKTHPDIAAAKPPDARTLIFPQDRSLGALMDRDWSPDKQPKWQELSPASGEIFIPAGKEVKLNFAPTAREDLAFLNSLKQNQIQALKFENIDLTDLELRQLKKLSGLRELDIPNSSITQAGFEYFKALKGLKKLNLGSTNLPSTALKELSQILPYSRITIAETMTSD